MNIAKAVALKLCSVLLFSVMTGLIRYVEGRAPVGEVVFFRSFFAIFPVVLIYALRGELRTALHTKRPLAHLARGMISVGGMFVTFAALARIPLVDVTAIGFAAPLMTVALAAVILKEDVRLYRWTAVGIGFIGVVIILWPYLDIRHYTSGSTATAVGAICAVGGAFAAAGAIVQSRRLADSESTSSIVIYLSLFCAAISGMTLPFVWQPLIWSDAAALIAVGFVGGLSHIFLTESFRHAPTSSMAPLDYTAILWTFLIGFFFFGELPTLYLYIGGSIVCGSGLFVIWRERQLAAQLKKDAALLVAAGPPSAK